MYTSFSTFRYNLFDTLLYIDVIMALAEPKFAVQLNGFEVIQLSSPGLNRVKTAFLYFRLSIFDSV